MNTQKKIIIQILFIISIIIFAAIIFIVSKSNTNEQIEYIAPPVRIIQPSVGIVEQSIILTGFAQSNSLITVVPKAQGLIIDLPVRTGQYIAKDTVIARIDPEPYRLQATQAQAAYTAVQHTWNRIENLYAGGSITKQVYDQTQAQYEAALSQKELAELQLRYTTVTAPVSGIVLKIHSDTGNTVALSSPLITIAGSGKTKIHLNVPEHYFTYFTDNSYIHSIGRIVVEVPALQIPSYTEKEQSASTTFFNASIETITPFISSQSRTFEVVCRIENALNTKGVKDIPPGMFVKVHIVIAQSESLPYLPYTALTGGTTLWYIEDGYAKKLPYEKRFEGDDFFVLDTRYANYDFIIAGQHFLTDATPVRIIE